MLWIIIAVCAAVGVGLGVFLLLIKKKKKSSAPSARSFGQLASGRIRLCLESDSSKVWEISLDNDIIVGRHPDCAVHIDVNTVSRRQCRIFTNPSGVAIIENLSNTNHTRINGAKVNGTMQISQGDKIKFGRTVLLVQALSSDSSGVLGADTRYINV